MSSDPQPFLDVARRIGERLVRTAEWEGGSCTWTVMSPDRENPDSRKAVPTRAGAALYEGTVGIALFLAELYGVTRDESILPVLEGALRFSLDEGAQIPPSSFGFHSGRPGIAYVAVRAGEILGDPGYAARAQALLEPVVGQERGDRGLDVIAGGAGAIPALLRIAGPVDAEMVTGIARNLGDHLIAVADHETGGWSWATMRSSSARNLCGYAHGAAGFGHGFLELYAATGEGRFLYAAEQAFLYERQFLSAEHSNWPDLRHTELGEYLFAGRTDQLRDRLRAGDPLPPYQPRYMSAWCHGGPGIGLTRLRAWELLRDPLYLDEARAAIQATLGSLGLPHANYSLCHGQGGNCETLLVATEVLGEPEWRERAAECALEGKAQYEDAGRPWPCGTLGAVNDPGLLLGEAGIGHFFLRLASPEVPSVLLVTPHTASAPSREDGSYDEIRVRTVNEHFRRTQEVMRHLGVEPPALEGLGGPGAAPVRSDAEWMHEAITARIAAETDDTRRAMLEDAFRLDAGRFDLVRANVDHTTEFLDALARLPEDEVAWAEGTFQLSPRARLVHSTWDWTAWLEGGAQGEPEADDVFHLLQVAGTRVTARQLSPFAALVLQSVEAGATLSEVASHVAAAISGDRAPDRDWLEARVEEQLRQAYRAGFVEHQGEMAAAGA
jgi:hypothetical protein